MLIDEINKHLDKLVTDNTKERTESIKSVYNALCPQHFMWLPRIMLGDIRLNLHLANS